MISAERTEKSSVDHTTSLLMKC